MCCFACWLIESYYTFICCLFRTRVIDIVCIFIYWYFVSSIWLEVCPIVNEIALRALSSLCLYMFVVSLSWLIRILKFLSNISKDDTKELEVNLWNFWIEISRVKICCMFFYSKNFKHLLHANWDKEVLIDYYLQVHIFSELITRTHLGITISTGMAPCKILNIANR